MLNNWPTALKRAISPRSSPSWGNSSFDARVVFWVVRGGGVDFDSSSTKTAIALVVAALAVNPSRSPADVARSSATATADPAPPGAISMV